jgi:type IV pilus assembly protein PilQ
VDFRRTRDGGGRVVVNLTDPGTPVDIRQEGGRVVAIFKDTSLPAELMRRLDVMDFATPVSTVDTLRTNLDTRIVISAEGKFEQLAYQSDNEFTIEINPVADEIEAGSSLFSQDKEYEGQRLTLNFQDIETRAVLQLLAETSGRNIVVSDTVQGNVTLRLRNVPWDQALDIVMTTKGLDMRQNGNVIMVAPAEEIAARETADLEAKNAISELEPMYSEFLQVNYAKASDLASLIRAEDGGGNAMLSDRGSIAVDDRTNTLLVQDTAERLQDIRRMVRTLDVPIKQVLIESRIVVVNDDFSRDLGVRLGFTAYNESGTGDGAQVISGTGTGTDTMIDSRLRRSRYRPSVIATTSTYRSPMPQADSRWPYSRETTSLTSNLQRWKPKVAVKSFRRRALSRRTRKKPGLSRASRSRISSRPHPVRRRYSSRKRC